MSMFSKAKGFINAMGAQAAGAGTRAKAFATSRAVVNTTINGAVFPIRTLPIGIGMGAGAAYGAATGDGAGNRAERAVGFGLLGGVGGAGYSGVRSGLLGRRGFNAGRDWVKAGGDTSTLFSSVGKRFGGRTPMGGAPRPAPNANPFVATGSPAGYTPPSSRL